VRGRRSRRTKRRREAAGLSLPPPPAAAFIARAVFGRRYVPAVLVPPPILVGFFVDGRKTLPVAASRFVREEREREKSKISMEGVEMRGIVRLRIVLAH